ncbi:MAG TPA: nitroreductase family protein [candidate division Zixibacteria bacterium]|nr:nitroreductase family protein [candidate division Zixibacteria bacterium]
MELMDAILTRRSIRKFTKGLVSEDDIKILLEAAMQAPSAGNQQPWHFIVINERKILDAIPKFHEYSKMLKQAPVAILICAEVKAEKYCGYWVQDCSAATQNILLAAHNKGLGAVWLGIYPMQDRIEGIKKLLNLPAEIYPLSLIAIGYPAEQKEPVNRFDSKKIRYNSWE